MAVRYAVATGNWSNTTTWNGGTLPTSADDVYSNNFTVTIDQDINVLTLRNTSTTGVTAGGSFVINDSVTITTTNSTDGFVVQTGITLLTYNGTGNCTVIGKNTSFLSYAVGTYYLILHTGTGTVNLIGDFVLHARNRYYVVYVLNNGILNFTGNVYLASGANEIRSSFIALVGAASTAYITGNINTTTTSVGAYTYALFGALNGRMYITGNLLMGYVPIISSGETSLLSVIGTITKDVTGTLNESLPAISRTSTSAINLFSGPFVCSKYGFLPIQCARMHLIPTANSYFEFRDETTNGAVSPGAIAPATRLVSPSTIIDAPSTSDVRYGVTYSLGSQTGTLRMPTSNQVAYGIPVDNTTGSAVLTPDAVWNYLVSNITDSGSIGSRLKNVSTPQIMGAQIVGLVKG